MLLSNMTKVDSVSLDLLALRLPFPRVAATISSEMTDVAPSAAYQPLEDVEALDLMLEVFLKGEGKKYNPNADYDFLASVFANVSTVRARPSWSACSDADLIDFVDHSGTFLSPRCSVSRTRAAARQAYLLHGASVDNPPWWSRVLDKVRTFAVRFTSSDLFRSYRNSAFLKEAHSRLVAPTNDAPAVPGSIDLLPQMLLPLCGPEEFDLDVRLNFSSSCNRSSC